MNHIHICHKYTYYTKITKCVTVFLIKPKTYQKSLYLSVQKNPNYKGVEMKYTSTLDLRQKAEKP